MKLPTMLNDTTPASKQVISFLGFNRQEQIQDGEMREMKNLSSDYFPALHPRKGRGKLDIRFKKADGTEVFPSNVIVHNGNICAMTDTDFWYGYTMSDNVRIATRVAEMSALISSISGFDADTACMAALNERVYVFPYAIYFNSNAGGGAELNVCGTIGMDFDSSADTTEQNTLTYVYDSAGLKDASVLSLFFNTESAAKTAYRMFIDYASATLKIEFEYDTNTYSNMGSLYDINYIGADAGHYKLDVSFGSSTFANMPNSTSPLTGATKWHITTTGTVPVLDFVVERDNRLWGCSNEDNTIYSSKLGSGMTWDDYSGLTTDSFAMQLTSDGMFTGICKFSTHIIFFKEYKLHKIYGSIPSNFTLQTTEAYGVQQGSYNSIASLNGVVYYHSLLGIMAYSGSYPTLISQAFGDNQYWNAVSAICGTKYYVSLMDKNTDAYSRNYHLLAYDTQKNVWMREDNSKALNFFRFEDSLYMIRQISTESGDTNDVAEIDSDYPEVFADSDETSLSWSAVLGPFDEYVENRKIYSTMQMRLRMEPGSRIEVQMKTDDGEWFEVDTIYGTGSKSVLLPIVPRRCQRYEIKIIGKGDASVQSILRRYRTGGRY